MIVAIVALLAAVAAPRFFDNQVFAERGYYDELVAAVRYGQKVAVGSGCAVRVAIDGSGYTLRQQVALAGHCDSGDATFPVPVRLSDGQAMDGTTPPGVAVGPPVTFGFDALGRTDLPGSQTISVGARSFTIEAESGLVVGP